MSGHRADTPMASAVPVRRFPLRPHHLVDEITPTSQVFVLAPLGVPDVDVANWELEISGLVEEAVTLSFDDILRFPKQELRAFHECAGNPRQPTLPTRRIANVIWGGIALSRVFERVRPKPEASFLWACGLDHGLYEGTPVESYVKDLPLDEAIRNAFLAYELNGEPLTREHGYPVRLVMPGYYGTNSVKWVSRLELANSRSKGLFTTTLYNDPVTPDDPDFAHGGRPVWRTAPESVIVSPKAGETLAGPTIEIWGWAWAHDGIRKVEVSADGGHTWQPADLGEATQRSWQRFSLSWRPSHAGPVELMARAADRAGAVQPQDGARNAIHVVAIEIVATG